MKLSMSACKQTVQPLVNYQGVLNLEPFFRRKDKVVFVMGATGSGKSRLAIDLATRFPAEIVNSDKIQVYKGLDIVTNKVTEEECQGVPHHLLGIIDQPNANFTSTDFRSHASLAIESILSRDRLPIIAGGSNSYIEALVNGGGDGGDDDDDAEFQQRYECCFLWVDVSLPVLHSSVSERVDRMIDLGLVNEVKQIFDPQADYTRGIRRAIGVPELEQYLRAESLLDRKIRIRYLDAAVTKIKENTCDLSCHQLQKIHRLYNKWKRNMHRIDATEVFLRHNKEDADQVWEKLVARPSTKIIRQFLYNENHVTTIPNSTSTISIVTAPVATAAAATAATATH